MRKGVTLVEDFTDYRIELEENRQEINMNRFRREKSVKSLELNDKILGEIEARDQAMRHVRGEETPGNDPIIGNSNLFCFLL